MRLRTALISISATSALLAAAATPAAAAVAACPAVGPVTTVVQDGSFLESSAFDAAGRLVYDDWISGQIRALDSPTAAPRSLGQLRFPGGIDRAADGRLAIAEGNASAQLIGGASVFLLDTTTGVKTRVASNLVGANGLARAADGTTYTSDVYAGVIDRVAPNGTVTRSWVGSRGGPNGLTLSADGRTLYVNMSIASTVVAIDTVSKTHRTVYRVAGGQLPDGIAIDAAGRLYLTLYVSGEVHRVDPATGVACRLASGLQSPTSVALSPGTGSFDPASAYVTTSGAIKRIAGAVPSAN